jgi:6,7-dimethyl-8-ribityllumazine synthase
VSGEGAPPDEPVDCSGLAVGVVAARWHNRVMEGLLDGARRALAAYSVSEVTVVRVPGTFELPVVAAELARSHDAVIALGVVVRGGTPHFEYVCSAATHGLTQVAIDTGTPVGFGVLTCDDDEQALARAGLQASTEDKGYEAAAAALLTARALVDLRAVGDSRGATPSSPPAELRT